MPEKTLYLTFQRRGLLTFPADLRQRHDLDKPGAQVAVVEREDGVIELHPQLAVPADQTWFWTDRWQRMEREVDAHLERGETREHAGPDELFAHLDNVADNE